MLFIINFIACQNFNESGNKNEYNRQNGENTSDNYLQTISGTWKGTDSSYSFIITNTNVLFQYPNPVPPGATVTYGNFQCFFYDGTTVRIHDYDNNVISFNAIIVDDTLTISGLNTIKVFNEPFESRDYRPWNTTYTKK